MLSHCTIIFNYFKQKLNTKFSISSSIARFKHYIEIYYKPTPSASPELSFQKEFDLFMFNSGYFALSQGQVGNARFDDIIITPNNSFLCELKQIGFGKTRESTKAQIQKFQGAKIQAQIYHERLKHFSLLSNDVYIIIFSKIKLRFKNGTTEVQRDGLNFKFELVYIGEVTASSIKKIEYELDLEEIIS